MRYYFTKESCTDGVSLLKNIFKEDGTDFIKSNLIGHKNPIVIEDPSGKKYRVFLVLDKIHVERLR